MIPRVSRNSKGIYEAALDQPLFEWTRQGPYRTEDICRRAKESLSILSESKVRQQDSSSVAAELGSYAAECVAEDDPRMRKK
jgi:hypothetical protein